MTIRHVKLLLLGFVICAAPALPANAATMKECAAQWQKAKTDKTTGGKTYKEFSKDCMAGSAAAPAAAPAPAASTAKTTTTTAKPASAPAAAAKPAATTAATTTSTEKKQPSPAQEAMYERERACGAEWKEAKAAGKVKAGMKWPQYWSECNKRMKAAGK
jgi:hypothetical protein